MARPIKETPTLYGADARRFEQLIANKRMNNLTELGISGLQQISQSVSHSRALKPSYFKNKKGSNTAPRLYTHIVELKGGDFDLLKV